jgi:hypothetical protein
VAGGLLKGFGGVALALGILLALGAVVVAAFALLDQKDNQDHSGPFGVAEDRDRSDRDQALLVAAGIGGAAGVVLVLLGTVLLSAGGARGRRSLERAVGGGGQAAPMAPQAPPPHRSKALALVGAAVAVAVVVLLVLVNAASPSGMGGLRSAPPASEALGTVRLHGSTSAGVTVLGASRGAGNGDSQKEFGASAGTGRVQVVASWEPATGGSPRLQVHLERLEGQEWVPVADGTGAPGFSFNATGANLDGAQLRARVFPADDGATWGQEFTLDVLFWRA